MWRKGEQRRIKQELAVLVTVCFCRSIKECKLVQALEKAISDPNIEIRLNTKVKSLERLGATSSWRIQTDKNEMLQAEAVCLAVPSYVSADLLSDVAPPTKLSITWS